MTLQPAQPVYDRPESELGRGKFATEPWTLAALGAVALLLVIAIPVIVLVRVARARRADQAPISSRNSYRPGPPSSGPRTL